MVYDNIGIFSQQEIFKDEWFFEFFDSTVNEAVIKNQDLFDVVENILDDFEEITFEEQDTGFEKIYMFCVYLEMENSEFTSIKKAIDYYIKIIYNLEKKII